MLKVSKKIITLLVIVCVLLQTFVLTASAAVAKVTLNAPTQANVGDTITVKAIIYTDVSGGLGSVEDGYLTYSSSLLKLTSYGGETTPDGAGRVIFDIQPDNKGSTGVTITLKFKVLKAGTASIKFSGFLVDWNETMRKSISASKSITIIDKSKLPKDANLKAIKLSAGSLSPAFSASTTSYSVKVPYSTTKVVVTPTLSDAKAKWSISGSSSLKVGTNTRVITVTAQNGSTKKYTIKITREPDPDASSSESTSSEDTEPKVNPYEISVNGEMWVLLNDYSLITVPAGFSVDKQIINGIEMPVLVDKKNGRTVVYATNEADTIGAYYIYTGEDNEYIEYKFFVTDSNTYVIVEPENVPTAPDGFKYQVTEVMGYEIGVYEYNDPAYRDYVIFFVESPTGEKNYYRYDRKEATIQRATDFILALEKQAGGKTNGGNVIDKFTNLDTTEKVIACSAAALVLLIIALIIVNIVKLSSPKKKNNEALINMDDEAEPLNFEGILNGEKRDGE
ncbi:MAG: cadherin-like beta sandwich domain-containing protein [Clostridia bacterium]|nr:cadherin-like beta sandwich domain-containing protein [Clostridia bacterium]